MSETLVPYQATRRGPGGGAPSNGTNPGPGQEMVSAHLRNVVWAETKLRFWTARELAEETPAEVDWVVEPWAATRCITEVDGKIKLAGKTTWVAAMCRAALDGAQFMGKPTQKTPIVYLTEQSHQSFRQVLRRARLEEREDFHTVFWHEAAGIPWPEVVEAAALKALACGARLLVVDTLGRLAGLRGDDENSSGPALAAMEPLKLVAAVYGLAVVVVRHDRKGGGEVGDSARGSSAFGGEVDIIISLRRPEGNAAPNIRMIHALSRFDETPDRLVIALTDDGNYIPMGSDADYAAALAEHKLREWLPGLAVDALTLPELVGKTGCTRSTLQRALEELAADGEVHSVGDGKRGSPQRFWRPSDPHSGQPQDPKKVSAQTTHYKVGRNENEDQSGQELEEPPWLAGASAPTLEEQQEQDYLAAVRKSRKKLDLMEPPGWDFDGKPTLPGGVPPAPAGPDPHEGEDDPPPPDPDADDYVPW